LLAGVGAVAMRGDERHRRRLAVAISYGAGLAGRRCPSPGPTPAAAGHEARADRFRTVPDPGLAVLRDTPRLFIAVRIYLT
jgi:hypothetical protein